MDKPGIWNVRELKAANPPAPGEQVKWAFFHQGQYSTTNLVQIVDVAGLKRHIHREHDEIIQIVEGEGEFRVGDRVERVKPGDVIVAPAGTPHGAKTGGLVLLSVFAPGQDMTNFDRVVVEE